MKLKLNWDYANGTFDTETVVMVDFPARKEKRETNAQIAIVDGMNFCITEIELGDLESSNAFAKELCRRWNDFPQELKKMTDKVSAWIWSYKKAWELQDEKYEFFCICGRPCSGLYATHKLSL